MTEQPDEMRYTDVTLFVISKKAEGETGTVSEMDYGSDLTAALEQGELLHKSMEQVCGVQQQAIFVVFKDFGNASAKTFNLPDWLMSRDHYQERYGTLSKLFDLGYTDSESMRMLLRFPDDH